MLTSHPKLPKKIHNKINELDYICCSLPEHQNLQLSLVCLDDSCKLNRLICSICEQQSHSSHNIIPLKDYVLFIYQQRQSMQIEKKSQSKSLFCYMNQIEELKLHCLRKIHEIKNKFLEEIDEAVYHVQINSNKYLERAQELLNAHKMERNVVQEIRRTITDNNLQKLNSLIEGLKRNYKTPENIQAVNDQIKFMSLANRLKQIQQNFETKVTTFHKNLSQVSLGKVKSALTNLTYQDNFNFDLFQRLFDWNPNLKSPHFTIKANNTKIIYTSSTVNDLQRFGLMSENWDSKMRKKVTWAIKINNFGGWIGVGLCIQQVVLGYKLKFNSGSTGHGSYMISFNGYTWSHSEFSHNAKYQSFNFYTGDIIIMQYDPLNSELKFRKHKKDDKVIVLKIAELKQNEHLCPCINMCSINDEVEIIAVPK